MNIGLSIVFASMLLVVVEAITSYYNGTFLPSQIIARFGKPGISVFTHGGMWGDLFLLPTLFAFVIVQYCNEWNTEQIVSAAIVGISIAVGNHTFLILTQTIPDPLGWKEEWWSITIELHFVYMSTYAALAVLFYFFSPNVSVKAAVVVSVVLGVHMALGTHIPLGLLNLWHQWSWCPTTFLTNPVIPFLTAGIWIGLSILSWITAGGLAGLSVAGIAVYLAILVLILIRVSPVTVKLYG